MAKLTSKKRNSLPEASFALPGARKYPINDRNHARDALARVAQHGTPAQIAEVRGAVHKKFPSVGKAHHKAVGKEIERRLGAKDR